MSKLDEFYKNKKKYGCGYVWDPSPADIEEITEAVVELYERLTKLEKQLVKTKVKEDMEMK